MAKQTINIGSIADDGTGTTVRAGGDLINDNFNEIYTELGDGSTLAVASKTQTLTNKTINGPDNTLTNIANGSLVNSSFTLVDESSTAATISLGETLKITGGTNLTTAISGDTLTSTLNSTITGLTSVQTETLTNASGNLLVDSTTYITEFKGGSSTDGQIQLNCSSNSHGQIIKSQPHSEAVTNSMLLPKGSNSTLVSEIATQTLTNKSIDLTNNTVTGTLAEFNTAVTDATLVSTAGSETLTNKTIGVGQLTCVTRAYTGDGSTAGFTVTNGQTVDNVLVFLNGVFQRPTTDYTVSGTTLTFVTAPIVADVITIKEL